jgi:hypothetical protein
MSFCAPLAALGKPIYASESGAIRSLAFKGGHVVTLSGDRIVGVSGPVQ